MPTAGFMPACTPAAVSSTAAGAGPGVPKPCSQPSASHRASLRSKHSWWTDPKRHANFKGKWQSPEAVELVQCLVWLFWFTKSALLEPVLATYSSSVIAAVLKEQLWDLPSAAVGRSPQDQIHRYCVGRWFWLAIFRCGSLQPLPCPGRPCMSNRKAASLLVAAEPRFNFPLSTPLAVETLLF